MNKRLWGSVSGGATSMMMARFLQLTEGVKGTELKFVFANTGEEHPRTLEFLNECDKAWSLGVIWLESVTHLGVERASTHKVVTFETAARAGEPFERMIEKYGVPNKSYPHCNRELKLNPMKSFIRSIGWEDVPVAVGIRADEPKRLRKAAESEGIVYPFAHWWPQDKQDVISWWEEQPFNLGIQEREGNCKWCRKKTLTKHAANIATNPEWYDFPRRMEAIHGITNRLNKQVFFRGALSTDELFKAVSGADPRAIPSEEESGGCTESCEAFADL
jgi:hypothetical protein